MNNIYLYFFDDDLHFLEQFSHDVCQYILGKNIVKPIIHSNPILDQIIALDNIQIFFLDIEMPNMNGLDLAKVLRVKFPKSYIIFISSHDKYVFSSFEVKPMGYVQKKEFKAQITNILDRIFDEAFNFLVVFQRGVEVHLLYKDILFLSKYTNNVELYSTKGIYKIRSTLENISNTLNEERNIFIRVHKSTIVNLMNIERFDKNIITLYNSTVLHVSRQYIENFKNAYYNYLLE